MRGTISSNTKPSRSGSISDAITIQRSPSLADEVYDVIFGQLMALKIAPGSRITVDNLVRELNVSHTPIREALGRLEGEGLVNKAHLVGYSAAPQISRRKFDELYELRLLLEPDAAKHAVANMNETGMKELQEAAGVMFRRDGTDERVRYSTFARQDAIFHDKILDLAGNQLIRETLAHQHTHFHIFRLMFHSRVTEEALDEHDAIVTAISRGDAFGAEQAMRNHILHSRDRLLEAFD
jgi:DNA-binding GntR family transcriptional regulator